MPEGGFRVSYREFGFGQALQDLRREIGSFLTALRQQVQSFVHDLRRLGGRPSLQEREGGGMPDHDPVAGGQRAAV